MKQITITTATGTVSFLLAKGSIPTMKSGVLVFETKDGGTKTLAKGTFDEFDITDATATGKSTELEAVAKTKATELYERTVQLLLAAKSAADIEDENFAAAVDDYVAARAALTAAIAERDKHAKNINRSKEYSRAKRAEKKSKAADAATPTATAFAADEPIAAPSAPAPITAAEATKKSKKSKK